MDSEDRRYRERSPPDRHYHGSHHHSQRGDRDRSLSPDSRRAKRDQDSRDQSGEDKSSKKRDAIVAAAAAAARINAQIQSKLGGAGGGSTITANSSNQQSRENSESGSAIGQGHPEHGSESAEDNDFTKDIEINHLRNRYTLTRGQTQSMIKQETGADVTTRGRYYPDKSLATEKEPPLYLHVTSLTKEGLDKAVKIIEDLISDDSRPHSDRFKREGSNSSSSQPPPGPSNPSTPVPQHSQYGNAGPPPGAPSGPSGYHDRPYQRQGGYRQQWQEEKVLIGLDYLPGFNLRGQVVGPMGANVKHIQNETGCRVQIKGRGSQFIEQATGKESEEPTYLHIRGPDPANVARAVELASDLIKTVVDNYNTFKSNSQNQPRRFNHHNGHQSHHHGGSGRFNNNQHNMPSGGGYNQFQNFNKNAGYTTQLSPSPEIPAADVASPPSDPSAALTNPDYTAYYAAVAAGQDPYAAYGGYENYVRYYQQYYAQYYSQMQQQPQTASVPGSDNAAISQQPDQSKEIDQSKQTSTATEEQPHTEKSTD
ncbi:hypothetical protein V1511DRAFT_261829 [Dipodascopsis uninucleata]